MTKNSHRTEFRTTYEGLPMQIEVGLETALARLNCQDPKTVEARLINVGGSDLLATSGPIVFTGDVGRREFYKNCEALALTNLRGR